MQKNSYKPPKKSNDSILIYGRNFDDKPIKLSQVVYKTDEITLQGKIINFETLEIPKRKSILMFTITDFTDTITVKMFMRNEQLMTLLTSIKEGVILRIKGVTVIDKFDNKLKIGCVSGIKLIIENC